MKKAFNISKRIFLGLLIINLLLSARAWYYDTEIRNLDETSRKVYTGDFVETNQGWTRYQFRKGDSLGAPLVLFIGGLTTDGIDYFNPIAEKFAKAGLSTLQFDLFGRGGSDRLEDADFGRQTFIQQIDDLLYALGINQPIHLVGQSLGGSIAVAWASQNPNRTKSLSLHASAGHIEGQAFVNNLLETPILGKYLFWLYKDRLTTGRVANYFDEQVEDSKMIERIEANIRKAAQFNGYYDAVYRTIINYDAHDLEKEFSALGESDVPVQIIWGQSDEIIPIENAEILSSWLGNKAELVFYENLGHMPLAENISQVSADVLHFIKSKDGLPKKMDKVIRKDDKILIVGAAIGGLTTALALSQKGFNNISILDKAPTHESTAPLVPINLGANAVRIFGKLGLEETLMERSYIWRHARIITSDEKQLGYLDAEKIQEQCGFPLLTTSRRHMQNTLLNGLSNVEILRGVAAKSYQEAGDSVIVHLDNGQKLSAALLIGADGNKSISRDYVMGETELISDGNISIQALIPRAQLAEPNHIGLVESFTEVVSELGSVGFGLNSEDTANIF
ncbi:MAG: alpha/beta fold hydrolase, partial [Bacteroidota bacterium]